MAFFNKYQDDYLIVGCGRTAKPNSAHHFIQADITTQAEEIVKETLQKFKRIDVLCNNAAIYHCRPLEEISSKEMMDVYNTNVIAPHVLSMTVFKMFWKDRAKRNGERNRNIINISSISGLKIYDQQGAYGPSKAALNMLTDFQARELEPYNIRVNALAPTAFPRIISSEKVAAEVVKMDQSNNVNQIKIVD